MTSFTDRENDELLSYVKYLTGCRVMPIESLETSITELWAPAVCKESPLKTAEEAILLNDMFASFLCSGKSGYVIAVSGGFGSDNVYHIVGAGNTGKKGVRRPSDKLCAVLARACTKYILSLNPNDMSAIHVASLDICHAEVARRLTAISSGAKSSKPTSDRGMRDEWELRLHNRFPLGIAALKRNLKKWNKLKSQEKTKVATQYGQLLEVASEVWDKIKVSRATQFTRQVYELNTIAKGLRLLRKFPCGTRVVFDWPQGRTNGDHSKCQPSSAKTSLWKTVIEDVINKVAIRDHELLRRKWKEAIGGTQWEKAILHTHCQLHCEIYLALHILFSKSSVRFHSFLVEERKQIFAIGCSKESCIGCWDILLGLFRQDSPSHPIYMCRTRRSHGKCYATWGLTPHVETLPPSLRHAVTGPEQAQMLKSLNDALKCSHQKFNQRATLEMLRQ
jgi:hypothetical protein